MRANVAAGTRLVPPAGAPLPALTVLRALLPGRADAGAVVRARLGVRHAFFLSSGRAALTVLLHALARGSRRREVVIPAYTCFSVPSAVARAGLTLRLCDVDPKTLDMDLNALARVDLDRVLCVIPSSLYGLPDDLGAMEALTRPRGVALVDDAAQCIGATLDGRPCGTFGDAGFYSLGRGKGITTMGGGILVTGHDDVAGRVEHALRIVPRASARSVLMTIVGSLLYAGLLAPSRYWLVDRVPFLELGGSHFDPRFPITMLSTYQRRLGAALLPRVDEYNQMRRAHAEQLRAGIDGVEGIEIPWATARAQPVYQRFPFLARDGRHRRALMARLRAAGIVASASYPTAIGDIPGIGRYLAPAQTRCPGARAIAARIVTLPTHPAVASADVERMVAAIREEP